MLRLLKTTRFIMAVLFLFMVFVPLQVQAVSDVSLHSYFTNTIDTSSLSVPHYSFSQFDMTYDSVLGSGITAHTYLSLFPQSGSVSLSFSEATLSITDPFNRFLGSYITLDMLKSIDVAIGLHLLPFGIVHSSHRYELAFSDTPAALASILAPTSIEGALFGTTLKMLPIDTHISMGVFNGGSVSSDTFYSLGLDTSLDIGADIGISALLKDEGMIIGADLTYTIMDNFLLTTELIQDVDASTMAAYGLLGYGLTDVIHLGVRYDYLDGASSDNLPVTLIGTHTLIEDSFFRFQYSMKDESLGGDIVLGL